MGRGSWAGPLTVAVVIPPVELRLAGVRDSKLLSPSRRAILEPRIKAWARAWAIGEASPGECDNLGMSEAQRLAWRRACSQLSEVPGVILVDGKWDFVGGGTMLVGGDRRSLAIAAASVLAKVHRDRGMVDLSDQLPWYDFGANKGYPSPSHRAGLHQWGPSIAHRTSWSWMEDLPWSRPGHQPLLPGAGFDQ